MTASAFVTRIETHRDPTLLWPLAGVLSTVVHGLLWLGVHPLRITSMPRVEADPIPVQLWLDNPGAPDTEAVEPSPSRAVAAPPAPATAGDSPAPPNAPAANQPPPIPAPEVSAPPPVASPPSASPLAPVVELSPLPSVEPVPPSPITPAVPSPATAPPVMPPAPVAPVSPPAAPVAAAPSQAGGGELSPVGLYAAAFGTDFPDTPPKLLDNTSLNLQPWLATCGWQNLGAIASPGLTARVQLQLQVQPDGTVAQATVVEGTGNSALDNLVSCVVQHQLRLEPATTAGIPQLTDAFILDTQVSF